MSAQEYETVASAAQRTAVCTRTIRRRIADGSLTAYRFGPQLIRLDPAEVDAVLRGVKVEPSMTARNAPVRYPHCQHCPYACAADPSAWHSTPCAEPTCIVGSQPVKP